MGARKEMISLLIKHVCGSEGAEWGHLLWLLSTSGPEEGIRESDKDGRKGKKAIM